MKEGDVSHEEANAAIAAADKTIIFARQNRLRDGLLLEDDKLPRFHAGHQNVKFFYSAVRQLPEYFLDVLLAKDISVTLVVGQGLLCFKDVRNWQAVHIGRTRRTIYLPEKLLSQAVDNGYDYWSIAHLLVTEGWKLLDFVLLYELVESIRQMMLNRFTTAVGYSAFRRLLRAKNGHRSSYESPTLLERRKKTGISAPINELEEFLQLYEPRFLKRDFLAQLKEESRAGRALEADEYTVTASSDAMAKQLYDEFYEGLWGERKATELFEELDFPDYFLLDRDIVHPAAREMAEAAGQPVEPQTMSDARHDFRDCQRFGLNVQMGTERFLEQAVTFGPDGAVGLIEEVVAPLFVTGKPDDKLSGLAVNTLTRAATHGKYVAIYFGRGLDLLRYKEILRMWRAVKLKEHVLHLEDFDTIRSVAVNLSATRSGQSPERLRAIMMIDKVEELFDNLRALIIGEAHRLLDDLIAADPRFPNPPVVWDGWEWLSDWTLGPAEAEEAHATDDTVQTLIDEELETAVVRLALCLDLAPEYDRIVARLVARGERAEQVVEAFLREAVSDPEQQMVVANARRALETARSLRGQGKLEDLGEALEDAEMLADLVSRVAQIAEQLPERFHTATSGQVSPLRRALREWETHRKRHPADTEQLAYLAMALVRLDRVDNYDELLDHIRWMGTHAVGEVLLPGGAGLPVITPGLIKVGEEEEGGIAENARALAEELGEKPYAELRKPKKVL